MIAKQKYNYTLLNTKIIECIENVNNIMSEAKLDKKIITMTCFAIEEILINNKEYFGEEKEFLLSVKKTATKLYFSIEIEDKQYDPTSEKNGGNYTEILNLLDVAPKYKYFFGKNIETFEFNINSSISSIIGIAVAIIMAFICAMIYGKLPQGISSFLYLLLQYLESAIFGVISMIAIPMVFLYIVSAIVESGNVVVFKRKGLVLIKAFLIVMVMLCVISTILGLVFFEVKIVGGFSGSQATEDIMKIFFKLIPTNFFEPFISGDLIKIVFLAITFGYALLSVNKKVDVVKEFFLQAKYPFVLILEWIGKLNPILIFVIFSKGIIDRKINSDIASLWKVIIVYFAIILVSVVIEIISVMKKSKKSIGKIIKILLLPTLKTFLVSSCFLAYSDIDKALKKGFNMKDTTVDFAIPTALACCQTGVALVSLLTVYFANFYNVSIDYSWILKCFIVCFINCLAVVPVPGGYILSLIVIFTSLGIPKEAVGIAIPLITVLDYFASSYRTMVIILETVKCGQIVEKSDPQE